MSLLSYSDDNVGSRAKSMKAPQVPGEAATIIVDLGREPERVALHTIPNKGKRRCAGEGCTYCAAELALQVSHVLNVDELGGGGEVLQRRLWLHAADLRRLTDACRAAGAGDAGSVTVDVGCEVDENAKSLRRDGSAWTILTFTIAQHEDSEGHGDDWPDIERDGDDERGGAR